MRILIGFILKFVKQVSASFFSVSVTVFSRQKSHAKKKKSDQTHNAFIWPTLHFCFLKLNFIDTKLIKIGFKLDFLC